MFINYVMVWTQADDVRLLTGLSTSDISDDDLNSLIEKAQLEVLVQINTKVIREQIKYLSPTRENEIDGTNKTYYIKNWEGNFISDANFDLSVTITDLTLVAVSTNDSTESSVTINSLVYDSGSFEVTTAQNNVDLFLDYSYSSFNPVTPDPLLKIATEYLTASYAYMRIDSGQKKKVRFGNVSITNSTGSESSSAFFANKYKDILLQLNESANGGAIWGESKVLI